MPDAYNNNMQIFTAHKVKHAWGAGSRQVARQGVLIIDVNVYQTLNCHI